MKEKGPSKTFTQEAVESWLVNLTSKEWEPHFDKSTLLRGRDLYRQGAITSLDLQQKQAVVSRKVDRKVTYSVIEWNDNTPEIRSSTRDECLGPAIAVAGMYEIEELIEEEHERMPLPEKFTEVIDQEKVTDSNEEADVEEETEEASTKPTAILPLVVELEVTLAGGLTATPKWKNGRSRLLVYAEEERHHQVETDRENLLRFVALAGQNHFVFEKKRGIFRLRKWNAVADFAEKILPSWRKSFDLKLKGDAVFLAKGRRDLGWEIKARTAKNRGITLRESFHLEGLTINASQSRRIAKAKGGLTFVSKHGLVRLSQDQMDDFEWWRRNRGKGARARWPRYMIFSFFARKYVEASPDGKLSAWKKSVLAAKAKGKITLPAFLRDYQVRGVTRMLALHKLGCHGLLADEMGLGKTAQALALMLAERTRKFSDLVVCPAAVIPVWKMEANERFPEINVRILGKGSVFGDEKRHCLWLASYTQLRRHRSLLDKARFSHAILDEAQLIKNPKAKVSQACVSIRAERRLALTGTPIENSPLDLWTIFRFLMPGLLGGRKELEQDLAESPVETSELLRRQVTPFIVRRVKSEVAKELPPKLETDLPCSLTEEQRREYRILVEGARKEHGDDLSLAMKRAPTHVFSLLTRLRQVSCDVALLPWRNGSECSGGKTELLLGKLPDLIRSGYKALIFSQFTSYLKILRKLIRKELPEIELFELTGNTRDRGTPVKAFEEATGGAIMLASLKAGGLGVTLRTADYVFLMDPWWNPAAEEQAIDRAHRLGRKKTTFVYRLIARGTVEERVRQLQGEKREAFRRIIGRIEPAGALANHFESLQDLINLRE